MVEATWKSGYAGLHGNADAGRVAMEITALPEITPERIVAAARDEGTELHKCFEWDDTAAAEKYRLYQARQVVCHLVIRDDGADAEKPQVRLFYRPDGAACYRRTELIVRDPDEYQQLLCRAWAELRAFKEKYAMLSELDEILALIR